MVQASAHDARQCAWGWTSLPQSMFTNLVKIVLTMLSRPDRVEQGIGQVGLPDWSDVAIAVADVEDTAVAALRVMDRVVWVNVGFPRTAWGGDLRVSAAGC